MTTTLSIEASDDRAKAASPSRTTPLAILRRWYGSLLKARTLKADAQLRDHLRGATPEMLRRAVDLRRHLLP